MTIYGIEYVDHGGVDDAYEQYSDAILQVMQDYIEYVMYPNLSACTCEQVENKISDLADSIEQLWNDGFIEDFAYTSSIELHTS